MAAKMTTEVTVEVHHMPIYPVSADEFEGITLTQSDIDLLARAERLVSEDNQETEKAVKALLCSETPPPVQGTNCCVSEIGEIEIERETSALQHVTDSSKQTNKLSRRRVRQPGGPKSTVQEPSKQNLQTCASLSTVTPTAAPPSREPSAPARRRRIRQACTTLTPVLTAGPTAARPSLSPDPFEPARPIRRRRNQRHKSNIVRRLFDDSGLRLNESVPEPSFNRVEGDTGGNDHPQQQHKHHESVRQPSFNRVDGDTAGYNHPQQQHEHHESVPDPLFDRAEDTGCYIHSQHPQDKVVLEIFNNVIRYIVSSNCNQRCTKTVLKKL
ncbi:uncharacterized protein LOC130514296 isoform X1 [Takifugu flavidus]|uniref:uncharacterized protein LOC130514296 isoform X1 n=1 Tax=Takifugu flavidus TaxID=433684 RepID=UPI0025440AD2|nr:uncharacterized protein LOC130514296 isoform X1 [Takifugu flavidus]